MNPLLKRNSFGLSPSAIKEVLGSIDIFDKIQFSNITKKSIKNKIDDLRNRQVPERTVLMHMENEAVVEYWFKNWLHPDLKHWVHRSPRDKRGVSEKILKRDQEIDMLYFYENGQQNYSYTLSEIETWLHRDSHE